MQHLSKTQELLLHLNLIPELSPSIFSSLIPFVPKTNLYDLSAHDISQLCQIPILKARAVVQGLSNQELLERELTLFEKTDFSLITLLDPEYPPLLKHIYLPPPILYIKGAALQPTPSLAIVGSRDANQYAQEVVSALVPDLVRVGFTIISGGARGVDSMAHLATIKAGGATIAILGGGLLHPVSATFSAVYDAIVDSGGSLISIFPLTQEAYAYNFPIRNRIISGMSSGCVVIQAALESGARITAHYALEQGREVFAVPGSIFEKLSAGCHALLQQGATPVTSSADILRVFGHEGEGEVEKDDSAAQQAIAPAALSVQDQVLAACKNPCTFDDLADATKLTFSELQDLLFSLQLQGLVMQNGVGLWSVSALKRASPDTAGSKGLIK